jgi:hypothetical protein
MAIEDIFASVTTPQELLLARKTRRDKESAARRGKQSEPKSFKEGVAQGGGEFAREFSQSFFEGAATKLFGDSELEQAQKTETSLQEALAVQDDPDKSAIENELDKLTRVRSALGEKNVEATLALDRQITATALERDKILSLQQDKTQERERNQQVIDESNRGLLVTLGADGRMKAVTDGTLENFATEEGFEAGSAAAEAKSAELGERVEAVPFSTYQNFIESMFDEANQLAKGGPGKTEARQKRKAFDAVSDNLVPMSNLLGSLIADPDALNGVKFTEDGLSGGVSGGLFKNVLSFGSQLIQVAENTTGSEAGARATIEGSDAFDIMAKAGIRGGVARSQVLQMGYALAKSLDPGGRLSDQDVTMAIRMLTGGAGAAAEVTQLLRERMNQGSANVQTMLASDVGGSITQGSRDLYSQRQTGIGGQLDQLESIMSRRGSPTFDTAQEASPQTARNEAGQDLSEPTADEPTQVTERIRILP